MTPLVQRDILVHQQQVPWPNLRQVEQDLLLCRAMTALFDDAFLKTQIAMRGGMLLHKVHLAPASRYSEDIDLVVIGGFAPHPVCAFFGNRPLGKLVLELDFKLAAVEAALAFSLWNMVLAMLLIELVCDLIRHKGR